MAEAHGRMVIRPAFVGRRNPAIVVQGSSHWNRYIRSAMNPNDLATATLPPIEIGIVRVHDVAYRPGDALHLFGIGLHRHVLPSEVQVRTSPWKDLVLAEGPASSVTHAEVHS